MTIRDNLIVKMICVTYAACQLPIFLTLKLMMKLMINVGHRVMNNSDQKLSLKFIEIYIN